MRVAINCHCFERLFVSYTRSTEDRERSERQVTVYEGKGQDDDDDDDDAGEAMMQKKDREG